MAVATPLAFDDPIWGLPGADREPDWGLPGDVINPGEAPDADREPERGLPGDMINPGKASDAGRLRLVRSNLAEPRDVVDWSLPGYLFKEQLEEARRSRAYDNALRHLRIVAAACAGCARDFRAMVLRNRLAQLGEEYALGAWVVAALNCAMPGLVDP